MSCDASQLAFGGNSAPAGTDKDGAAQGSGMGKDQQGKADNVNPVPGTSLPNYHGIMAAPPVVLGASGDADSTTRSAVSGGALNITNPAAQQQLTGQTAEEAAASISRDTSNTTGALAPIFDKDKIEAGFEITGQFMNQVGQFVQNRAAEADAAQKAANDPTLTPEQRAAAQQQADQLNADWGPNGTYRQALTALTVAAGGNVTGGMGELAQNAAVAYVQGLGANQVKQLVSLIGDGTAEGETARAALQAIVGCAGAAASSQACGAGAMGATSSSLIGWALGPADGLSAADKQARENLVNGLVGAVATATNGGSGAATVAGAGQIEVENNQLAQTVPPPGWLSGFKLPGYTGENRGKGGGVIVDNATDLDPSAKAGPLVTPLPDAKTIGDWITAIIPDQAKNLVEYVTTAVGGSDTNVPPSIVGADGKIPLGIGGLGTPISMPPTSNPEAIAEQFAKDAFNGQTPAKVTTNISGDGSWVAILPDGTAVTYRPAGQASSKTADTTATVEINNSAVGAVNNGKAAKFKFPVQGG